MLKKIFLGIFFVLSNLNYAQFGLGGLMNTAKNKLKSSTTDVWDKKRKDYDESNFNYAISFLDNSGLFEADEKGDIFSRSMSGWVKNTYTDPNENAYNFLKNGEMLMAGNKFYLAEHSFILAQNIYETHLPNIDSLNYSQTLNNLGLLYQEKGIYSKVEPLYLKSKSVREKLNNPIMLVVSINNLGVFKKENGYYAEAEKLLKDAYQIANEKSDALAKSITLNNLAMLYLDMNKLPESEKNMLNSLSEGIKVLKDNSSNFIKLKINLANIYRFEKKYEESEKIYLEAIALKEKKVGNHPDLAHLKKGLAQLYMIWGKNEKVEKLLISAIDIYIRKLGAKNPATISAKQELGNFYRYNSNSKKSLEILEVVVDLKKQIYGESNPNYIQALEDLTLTQWELNQNDKALSNYKLIIENTLSYINTFFQTLNENEKNMYWEKTNSRLQRFYSFAYVTGTNNPEIQSLFYQTAINTKGFLFNNSSKIRNIIASSEDADLKNTYKEWLQTKENLNRVYQLSKDDIAKEKINVDSLKERSNKLERDLSEKSSEFKNSKTEEKITVEKIQSQLSANEAAIEIIELNEYKNGFTGKGSFVAFVIKNNALNMIEIGADTIIQTSIKQFRENVINQKPEKQAYTPCWKPLEKNLAGVSKIYLSLDGAYYQLSLNALADENGKYLIDKYNLQFVGNTKEILGVKEKEKLNTKPKTAFLIGNPFYGKNKLIDQLPGAEAEVKKITQLLTSYKVNCKSLYGINATEKQVKEINSPAVLHIATHGYFLPDLSQVETNKVLGIDVSAAKENPLLRCGLLLANCDNVFDQNFKPSPNSENGILTAYEAMSMNLDKTDLVVLSACETGLGSVKQGEGVYGLQRSFLIAGANSIIMSLWSVSDEATMDLMTSFYTSYAKTGDKQQSFINAIKQVKTKYKDPFFWSAFIMLNK
ncbi:MAG: CHAT domain-containing protein [Bacteroidetes bacterium]|nr:CHAT domain-containing protein [Bacteroidota bacterium]